MGFGQFDQSLSNPLFSRHMVALQLDVKMLSTKGIDQTPHHPVGCVPIFLINRSIKWSLTVTCERNESLVKFLQLFPEDAAFSFGCSKLGARNQSAEVAITDAVDHQDRHNRSILQGEFTSHHGT